ncbi:hypothetical protein [Burkholderia multivorans]|uniref:hypothetical protein n=1 Tax=Burkholderia multivorans TaxID=87883 RepID=UPI0020A10C45|nr:hypothetical protein [Burkholderia multivorans]
MLLYLNARDAQVVHDRAYSNAPRQFPRLGKRKRAERLAEIEQLYDRHVVGPAILDAEAAGIQSGRTDDPHATRLIQTFSVRVLLRAVCLKPFI